MDAQGVGANFSANSALAVIREAGVEDTSRGTTALPLVSILFLIKRTNIPEM